MDNGQKALVLFVIFVPSCSAHWRLPKGRLALLQAIAFIGATLCYIIDLHGYAVRSVSECEILPYLVK